MKNIIIICVLVCVAMSGCTICDAGTYRIKNDIKYDDNGYIYLNSRLWYYRFFEIEIVDNAWRRGVHCSDMESIERFFKEAREKFKVSQEKHKAGREEFYKMKREMKKKFNLYGTGLIKRGE